MKAREVQEQGLMDAAKVCTLQTTRNLERDIEVLKRAFTPAIYQDCLARHQEVLKRMDLL
jgi:hypothetical protein